MADITNDIITRLGKHHNRIERLEKVEKLSLSNELAHALGAGIAASAGVDKDASRHGHIHEITASDNPGAKVSLLQTDASGHLTIVQLNTTANHATTTLTDHIGEHTAAHTITLDNSVTIADAKDVILNTATGTKIGTAANQKLGFYGATPVVQRGAYTQTYSTATRTVAAPTAATLTDSTGGTANTTLAAVEATYTQATIRNNFADLAAMVNKLTADNLVMIKLINSLIDDSQAMGIAT